MNRYSEAYRAVFRHGDLEAAYARLATESEVTPLFETAMRLHTADEMETALWMLGCAVIGR